MTTIHTRQLQQYTQDNEEQYTQDVLKYSMYKNKQHQGKKVLYIVSSIFSPQKRITIYNYIISYFGALKHGDNCSLEHGVHQWCDGTRQMENV